MELENRETINVLGNTENSPPPRPIPPAVCKCGCGHTFQPRRKDQIYLNKQHADFGYNHNTRLVKDSKRKTVESTLRNNDNVLKKYFKAYKQGDCATCYLKALKEDSFDSAYFIGINEQGGKKLYYLYNYYYHISGKHNETIIKIYKR